MIALDMWGLTSLKQFLAVLGLCVLTTAAWAQQPTPTVPPLVAAEEEDPTKPIFFSLRNEYRNLLADSWANTTIIRVDRLSFRGLKNEGGLGGLLLRLDVPINAVHRDPVTKFGLGDIYGQALYLPYARRSLALAVGSGIVLPTATDDLLGQGKLIIAPTVIPVWYIERRQRFAFVRIQNYFSVAGKSHRSAVNYFVADPTLVHRLSQRWWVTLDNEFRWDWRTSRGSGIAGLQLGRMVQRKFGFWIKPEFPWGPGRTGDVNLKFTVFRVR